MPAQRIVRGSGRAACHGRQSLGRGGRARSTRAVVESPDVLCRDKAQLAQRWSRRVRALARSVDVGLDRAGVTANLQPLVSWTCERGSDAGESHCIVCNSSWVCMSLKALRSGTAAPTHKAEPCRLRLAHQLNSHRELAQSSAHAKTTRALIYVHLSRDCLSATRSLLQYLLPNLILLHQYINTSIHCRHWCLPWRRLLDPALFRHFSPWP